MRYRWIGLLLLFLATATLFAQTDDPVKLRETLKKYEAKGKDDVKYVQALNDVARTMLYTEPSNAIPLAEKALAMARRLKDRQGEVTATTYIGNAWLMQGQYEKARDEYLLRALKLAREIRYLFGEASALNSLASISMNLGDYDGALAQYRQAVKIERIRGDSSRVATILLNVSSLLMNRGEYEVALEGLLNSIKVFEKTGQKDFALRATNNIAVLYHAWGNIDKALDYYFRCVRLYRENGDSLGVSIPLNNIGEIYKDKGDFASALTYFNEAYRLSRANSNDQYIGVTSQGRGEAYKGLKRYPEAIASLNEAFRVFNRIGFIEGKARALTTLGEIALVTGRNAEAESYLRSSLDLSRQTGIPDLTQTNYRLLSETAAKRGDYKVAYDYFLRYSTLKDSLFTADSAKRIAEMNVKYETEKKDKENLLLRKNNEINTLEIRRRRSQLVLSVALTLMVLVTTVVLFARYRHNQRINVMLQEKNDQISRQRDQLSETLEQLRHAQKQLIEAEKMASLGSLVTGVAHEINTPVGIGITAASALRDRTIQLTRDYKADTMKRTDLEGYLQTAYQSSELLLKNLQRTGDLVQSFKQVSIDQTTDQLRRFRLKPYLGDLVFSVQPKWSEKSVRVELDIPEELEIESYPGAFASIFTNLMVNSAVHGFADRDHGTIVISAGSENGRLHLGYRDDGAGIPPAALTKVFDPFFTTNKHLGSGLGLHIVYNLVTQRLAGTIECHSEPGAGAEFAIDVPLSVEEAKHDVSHG